ncbi:MAG: hypothetical protein SFU87_04750 [Chitinophagaceae bacterium]|nr:hypothetical protein [Chitinophagaceae bacterium]
MSLLRKTETRSKREFYKNSLAIFLKYYPNEGFDLKDMKLKWGADRETVRELLKNNHTTNDIVIDISSYTENKSDTLVQKRDVYKNIGGEENLFFLNYDINDILKELEIHDGLELIIANIHFSFENEISEVVSHLKKISSNYKRLNTGEYLFEDLKIVIADSETMGGEGDALSYFYCAKNIDHLAE